MRTIAIAVASAATLALAGCGGSTNDAADSTATTAEEAPATTTDAAASQRQSAEATVSECDPASENVVSYIDSQITEDGLHLEHAFVVTGDAGQYIGADFFDEAGKKASSADVWLIKDGVYYSLSSDARNRTSIPDGRDFASAGDEFGTEVQDCTIAAGRAR